MPGWKGCKIGRSRRGTGSGPEGLTGTFLLEPGYRDSVAVQDRECVALLGSRHC
jgi:hypothetical protein